MLPIYWCIKKFTLKESVLQIIYLYKIVLNNFRSLTLICLEIFNVLKLCDCNLLKYFPQKQKNFMLS